MRERVFFSTLSCCSTQL